MRDVQVEDLFTIEAESLKNLKPLYGVVFLFKYGAIDRQYAKDGNKPLDGIYDEKHHENGIVFANQTIHNACGTQAMLNVLLNKDEQIDIGPELKNLKEFVATFDSETAGETLSNSELIRCAHNSFSAPALFVDEDKPEPPQNYNDREDGVFHFIGYMYCHGQIYELDGLKRYPIKHGSCTLEDEFCEKLPEILQRRIAKYGDELRFSLLAITNNKLRQYQEQSNDFMVNHELSKRELWKKENELRRHDYLGLIVELLKNSTANIPESEWEQMLNNARKKSQSELLQNK